ncbi:Protein of unknown function [Nannocystis exedens]|uniref:DUF1264 domain-containing protein n=1 Tax=Nannocystis exedens TaxID=54 RepID=A0A1I2F7G0_9BACT|nr:DUF1264 domain-containing protein [Nannocystis exedens]PCC73027.1 hypothetical protein NAEX_06113 [Nannocystis exedens]SFF01252.1 Protein of unknown function [Nannocystis exedens]
MRGVLPARAALSLCALLGLADCHGRSAPPATAVASRGAASDGPARRDDPGRSATVRALESGTLGPQDRTPVDRLLLVLDGYTRPKREAGGAPGEGRPDRALFYCAQLNADFSQCVLFDGSDEGAHLVGVEYVISPSLYATLPAVERQYWHAHVGEIDSGVLVSPGLTDAAHTALMGELRSTYGKSWRTWDAEADPLPFGEPTLMWSISPGKLEPATRHEMRSRWSRTSREE